MQIGVYDDPQQLRYLLPALTADVCVGVLVVGYVEPQNTLALNVAPDVRIVRLGAPQGISICPALLNYVNCLQLLSGIRKPPDYSDGFMSGYLYPNRHTYFSTTSNGSGGYK